MSRVSSKPIPVPSGVEVKFQDDTIFVKGPKGELTQAMHRIVDVALTDGVVNVAPKKTSIASNAMAGTMRSLINNMVHGVSIGFEKKLELVGVGYRAQVKGDKLDLSLGFSHPVIYQLPKEVKVDMPSNTNIVLSSIDKQKLGQVAAEIRALRPPEPYKGKGVRYSDEHVVRKETKKK